MAQTRDFKHSNGPYGENIVWTSNRSISADAVAKQFHQLWVDSPGHYRNMTSDRYTQFGVGFFVNENGWYGTHVFR